jgi:SAM-dependent methyltransferase
MTLKERLYLLQTVLLKVAFDHGVMGSLKFISDYNRIRKDIKEKLAGVIKQYRIANPGVAYQKYLDVDAWVFEALRRVYILGLNSEKTKKKILDLGTGAGYFPFICNYYGHEAEALDVPDNVLYNQIIKELGIKRYTQYIHAYKDLQVEKKYDLITGFMICFNNHKTPQLWHIKEWDYFLKSVSGNNLNPGGNIFLSFNGETPEEPISKDLLAYFENKQGKIKAHEVALKRKSFHNEKVAEEITPST